MNTFTKDVDSTQEYKDAVKHAEALGFEVEKVDTWGNWRAPSASGHDIDDPVFISGKTLEVHKVGRKWFHTTLDGRDTKVRPEKGGDDDGYARITFAEVED